ncbi:MAG: hypothetical protein MI745_05280 [Pseudomonadales bacterium]|nr:hypothetical protein [Pseudomonadales bacterium]
MTMRSMRMVPLLLACALANADSMQPLDDAAMSGVTGREGIGLNMEFLINTDIAGDGSIVHHSCPAFSASTPNGTPDCRIALRFNDRDDSWLVLKDYHGVLRFNKAHLDAARTNSSPSGYCDDECSARFGAGFDPNNRLAFQLTYDHAGVMDNSAYYGDFDLYVNLKIAAEFGATGYLDNNTTGTALGFRAADGPNAVNGAAQMRFDGAMKMYGY